MADDPFANWMTLPEAAAESGCTRQAIHAAIKAGKLPARQFSNGLWLISRPDFDAWKSAWRHREARSFKLSPRQAEMLVYLHQARRSVWGSSYSHFVTTVRSLTKRGFVQEGGLELTAEGQRVARELCRQIAADLTTESPDA